MNLSDFDFELPHELIAQFPKEQRSSSRLLVLDKNSGKISHKKFTDILEFISPDDLLVFNDTKVIPARLFGQKITGGKIEILIERILDKQHVLAHIKASKAPKVNSEIIIAEYHAEVIERQDDLFKLKFLNTDNVLAIIEQIGHMPLPPYISRSDEVMDKERYQTVYAKNKGAVAAPTAGLHFDEKLLEQIPNKAFITLHVGAGTFQPIRVDDVLQHKMHSEYIEVPQDVCDQINATKKNGGRVIAVGTTCVRSLETASLTGEIQSFYGETDIFIYPGFEFKCIDAMITNFHLPKSTLMLLVSAFAGYDNIMTAYHQAIENKYRFFSYGDAMFII